MNSFLRLLMAAWLMTLCTCVYADGQPLSGAGLQLGYGLASTTTHDSTADDSTTVNQYGSSSAAATIGIGYAHSFDGHFNVGTFLSHFNLGGYVSVDLNRGKAGGFVDTTNSYEVQLRSLKSVAIEPGMVLGRTALIYLKAGYWRGDIAVDYKSSAGTPEFGEHRGRAWSAGLGLRSQVNRHITVGVEAEQLQFSKVAIDFPLNDLVLTETPKQLRAIATVGVIF